MTIGKGTAWGTPAELPLGAPVPASDAELAEMVAAAVGRGDHLVAGVGPGDLALTLGVAADGRGQPTGREAMAYQFDLGFVVLDGGTPLPFVAHVTAHRRWWGGEVAVAMNAAWVGDWYLGPRAHPNDGLLDVTVGRLTWRQRLLARSRVRTGTHVPHPGLVTLRTSAWEHRFARPAPVFADGRPVGRCRRLQVSLQADSFTLIG